MIPTILLTFDVEDWFQVENFKQCIPYSAWPNCELRIEKNVHRILDLLDSIKLNNSTNTKNVSRESASREGSELTNSNGSTNPMDSSNSISSKNSTNLKNSTLNTQNSPKGTFFVLGWIAERLPHLVREIESRGHEIASHGYGHELCCKQSVQDLSVDLVKSKELLEDITGNPVYGYRAPSFSISDNILQLIRQTGYFYDSSFNSFALHKRYGRMKLNGNGGNGILHTVSDNFYELPVSNLKLVNRILPWGGGGYFRLIPARVFKYGVQSILKNQGAYLFYLHPWEIDREQPRVLGITNSLKLRHYLNLDNTYFKLSSMLDYFKRCHFSTLIQYIYHQTQ